MNRIFLTKIHGIKDSQVVNVELSSCGVPKPLIAFDFDGTVYDSAKTYWLAARHFIGQYTSATRRVPGLDEFKMGVILSGECFHHWGLPRRISMEDAWKQYSRIILEVERIKPSKFFPGAIEMLQEVNVSRYIIFVTANTVLPVSWILKKQTGISFDVIVSGVNKSGVLGSLASFHWMHHGGKSFVPFYFFGDSPKDMKSAKGYSDMVTPVAVMSKATINGESTRDRKWREKMIDNGARGMISYDEIARAAFGDIELSASLTI